MQSSNEKAFIERLENEDVHGAAQMIEIADEMGLEVASEVKDF